MSVTVDEVRQDAIKLLSQVAGTGVQMYAEDKLLIYVRQAFNAIFKQDFWPQYYEWETSIPLDGTGGIITTTVAYAEYDDIQYIWQAGTRREVPPLPARLNPSTVTGSTAQFFIPAYTTANKPIQILPLAAAGSLDMYGRVHPGESSDLFNGDTTLKFDRDLLTIATALEYATDDGDNPNAVAKLQDKYNRRYKQVKPKRLLLMNQRSPDIPSSWYDR